MSTRIRPTGQAAIAAKMHDLLGELGSTSTEAADRLRALGIRGRTNSTCECIIARYLRFGLVAAGFEAPPGSVAVGVRTANGPEATIILDVPRHVGELILQWLDGRHPDLEDRAPLG